MIYVSWRVYLRPSCSGSGNMNFVFYTLVLDICCPAIGLKDQFWPLLAEVLLCQTVFQVVLLDKSNITQFAFNTSPFSCCETYPRSSLGGTILATPHGGFAFTL